MNEASRAIPSSRNCIALYPVRASTLHGYALLSARLLRKRSEKILPTTCATVFACKYINYEGKASASRQRARYSSSLLSARKSAIAGRDRTGGLSARLPRVISVCGSVPSISRCREMERPQASSWPYRPISLTLRRTIFGLSPRPLRPRDSRQSDESFDRGTETPFTRAHAINVCGRGELSRRVKSSGAELPPREMKKKKEQLGGRVLPAVPIPSNV